MNWQLLLSDLSDAGLSQARIADVVDVKQASISAISTGATKNPSYPLGLALIALHKKQMRKHKRATAQAV